MSLRKCQAIKSGEVRFEGLFHRWAETQSETAAIIELPDGSVAWWLDDIKFLEPEHPRVEVADTSGNYTGDFMGFFQCADRDDDDGECYPVALVKLDDDSVRQVSTVLIKFLEGGSDE